MNTTTNDCTAEEAWLIVRNSHPTMGTKAAAAAALVNWIFDGGPCPHPRGYSVTTEAQMLAICAHVLARTYTNAYAEITRGELFTITDPIPTASLNER